MTKETIRETTSLRQILNEYSVPVNKMGFCRCIFHKEKTASMRIYENTHSFYCWGCGKSGDIFDIVMQLEGVGFYEAFRKLGGNGHKPTVMESLKAEKRRQELRKARKKQKEINEEFLFSLEMVRMSRKCMMLNEPLSDNWCKAARYHEYFGYLADEYENELKELRMAYG